MQTLIVVDDKDQVVRYAPRKDCHAGDGIQHRAIMLLAYNRKKQLLLQKRKHRLFDNLWDLAGATHPVHLDGRDESYEESGARCLQDEWDIATPLERVLAFTYFARYGDQCENEYCMVLAGQYDGALAPNPEHAYDHRWLGWDALAEELARAPEAFTPWLTLAVERLGAHPWLATLTHSGR